jgi:hypothetical protein
MYGPAIMALVASFEGLFKHLPNPLKKQAVLAVIQPPPEHAEAVGNLVDTVVGSLKSTPLFQSTTPVPDPAAAIAPTTVELPAGVKQIVIEPVK